MLPFLKGVCQAFVKFCSLDLPVASGWSISVGTIIVAILGTILCFKIIRGLFF